MYLRVLIFGNTLLEPNASKLDVIFGPLYSEQVKPLADFCRAYDIKLVIPFLYIRQ